VCVETESRAKSGEWRKRVKRRKESGGGRRESDPTKSVTGLRISTKVVRLRVIRAGSVVHYRE
jgi:hypothetical protein